MPQDIVDGQQFDEDPPTRSTFSTDAVFNNLVASTLEVLGITTLNQLVLNSIESVGVGAVTVLSPLDMSGEVVGNIGEPVFGGDAVNKGFIDTLAESGVFDGPEGRSRQILAWEHTLLSPASVTRPWYLPNGGEFIGNVYADVNPVSAYPITLQLEYWSTTLAQYVTMYSTAKTIPAGAARYTLGLPQVTTVGNDALVRTRILTGGPSGAISLRAADHGNSGTVSTTTINTTFPAGTQLGDYIIVVITRNNNALITSAIPTGLSLLAEYNAILTGGVSRNITSIYGGIYTSAMLSSWVLDTGARNVWGTWAYQQAGLSMFNGTKQDAVTGVTDAIYDIVSYPTVASGVGRSLVLFTGTILNTTNTSFDTVLSASAVPITQWSEETTSTTGALVWFHAAEYSTTTNTPAVTCTFSPVSGQNAWVAAVVNLTGVSGSDEKSLVIQATVAMSNV